MVLKPVSFLIVCIFILITFVRHTPAQPQEDVNTFDAFTSASKRLKIEGGTISKTSASILWNEWWEDDFHVDAYLLLWGKENGNFSDTLNLKPYVNKTTNTAVLESLEENTTYYARFCRVFEDSAYITDFYFNTPPLPPAVKTPAPIYRTRQNAAILSFSIYSLDGKSMCRRSSISPDYQMHSVLNPSTSGTYLIQYFSGDEKTFATRMVVNR